MMEASRVGPAARAASTQRRSVGEIISTDGRTTMMMTDIYCERTSDILRWSVITGRARGSHSQCTHVQQIAADTLAARAASACLTTAIYTYTRR